MPTQEDRPSRKDSHRTLIGAMIVVSLLAAAILIISLDELVHGQQETKEVAAYLPESSGLASGALVWIAGREVGEVVSVALLPPAGPDGRDRIVAVASIAAEHAHLVRTDSRAHLTSDGLMGPPILEISPGSAAAPLVGPGDTVAAAYGPDRVDIAIRGARIVLANADSLFADVRRVGAIYRARSPAFAALGVAVADASAELERTRAGVASGPLAAALADDRFAERVRRIRVALGQIRTGLARYAEDPLAGEMQALQARADALGGELATLDSAATATSGFIGRLGADSALARAATGASAQLDTLSREVLSNPLMFF